MKLISAIELKKYLDKNEVTLIDVREPAEYRSEHIKEAYLIPLAHISLEKIPLDPSKILVLHCLAGKRSQEACQKLIKENPELDIYSLDGGLFAWKKAGYDVKKSGKFILPLDRQTQCIAGFLAFSGVLLGSTLSSSFYFLSAFVGLGLLFSGITGWCGMAKLLAKMPWNQ